MAKIFMLVNYSPEDQSIGITKKISAQIDALRKLGHIVVYTAYTNKGVAIIDNNDNTIYEHRHLCKNKKYIAVTRYALLLHTAKDFIRASNFIADYCYGRISAPNNQYLGFLREMKARGAKIIIEALSYFPGVRPENIKSKYIAFFLNKNKRKLAGLIDKFITEGHVQDFYGIKTEKGRIGVDIERLPKHHYQGSKEELHLISVASEREYHGYDRLVRSFVAYRNAGGTIPAMIHLVGNLSESTKKLITESGYADQIMTYGRVSGDALFSIYAKCNIGVGPLGQHRIGGKKDTGLKTKEYFGLGLPYIFSGTEEDIPEGYPYVFQLPADESLINFKAVWEFYVSIRDDENCAENMRLFAKQEFSWESIMRQALIM